MPSTTRSMDMTQGAILPILLKFTVPILLGNFLQLLYNTIDSIIVGNLIGLSALAAVSATTPICSMLVKFFNGVAVGAGAVISQCFGAKDPDQLRKAIQSTICLTLVSCIVLTLVGFFSCDWILRQVSTPGDVFEEASLYLHIYFSGLSGLLLYNIGSATLRAVGETRRPLYFLFFSSVLNIMLDLLFVAAFRWGIAGVAAATVMSQMISAALVLHDLTYSTESYHFSWRELQIDRGLTGRILTIGLPVGLQMAIINFSNVFLQSYINFFDKACIAGWGCYTKLDQYIMLPIQSMGQAVTTFTGQNLGAKRMDRVGQGTRTALCMILALSIVSAAVICSFAWPLVRIFSPDAGAIRYGVLFIHLCTPIAPICSVNQILSGTLRGAGHAQAPMVITLCTHVVFRQIYLFFMSRLIPGNAYIIGSAYPAGWILCAAAIAIYYRFNGWKTSFQAEETE